ncbi:hypothetical protein [Mastigocladopsis repens]|uniref:hypothetical protein n=1 Tax=Mastigocladopsis repens TaxID=221287 RepID=UPI00037FA27D|nr:hypothetical protein [Mastigocladopsis repens]
MSIASDNNLLWVPRNLRDLLTVSVDWDADDSTSLGMQVINKAASQWLTGTLDDSTYFDLLDHYGIDPLRFVGEVEEHIELLMR